MGNCLENRQIHVKASYRVHEHQKQRCVPEAEGAEKSGNWFLARKCSTTGKAAGSAGVKHQGGFGGQLFPIESAPVGKELVIKEMEFLFPLPGMKIAGLLFNLLQLFGWGVRFPAGRSWLCHLCCSGKGSPEPLRGRVGNAVCLLQAALNAKGTFHALSFCQMLWLEPPTSDPLGQTLSRTLPCSCECQKLLHKPYWSQKLILEYRGKREGKNTPEDSNYQTTKQQGGNFRSFHILQGFTVLLAAISPIFQAKKWEFSSLKTGPKLPKTHTAFYLSFSLLLLSLFSLWKNSFLGAFQVINNTCFKLQCKNSWFLCWTSAMHVIELFQSNRPRRVNHLYTC